MQAESFVQMESEGHNVNNSRGSSLATCMKNTIKLEELRKHLQCRFVHQTRENAPNSTVPSITALTFCSRACPSSGKQQKPEGSNLTLSGRTQKLTKHKKPFLNPNNWSQEHITHTAHLALQLMIK